jgi:hypothetical protein
MEFIAMSAFITKIESMVANTYNPSSLGGGVQKDWVRSAQTNN